MAGLLSPKSSETRPFFLHDYRCVPGPWDFSPGVVADYWFLFFTKSDFGRGLLGSGIEENLGKKNMEHVHLQRSMCLKTTTLLELLRMF